MKYDLLIIGGGPAGTAAAVYAARKQLKTALVAEEFGGQSIVSDDIQNWIGTPHISGSDLAKSLKTHVEEYQGDILTIKEGLRAKTITGSAGNFTITLSDESTLEAKAVLIASGSKRRKLPVKGADEFENKGLTYCASCDGPLFTDQDVVVVGGGNAGFESAAQLLAYCKSVTLLNRGEEYKADAITVEKTLKNPKFTAMPNTEIEEVFGGDFVEGVTLSNGEKLAVTGIFVEIGQIPNSDIASGIVEVNTFNQIVIDPRTQATSTEGIWAAGDVTDVLYHQNNIAAGDAVRALEDIYIWLHKQD